jgi:hypothetical protein
MTQLEEATHIAICISSNVKPRCKHHDARYCNTCLAYVGLNLEEKC